MDFKKLASPEIVGKVRDFLAENSIESFYVANGREALEKIRELVPAGVSVMNGSSTTLNKIGFVDLLKSGDHPWNNLHKAILDEKNKAKQSELRKQALLSDYYLGSVHALTETGEFLIASNTGSQLPHVVYSSANLIFVVGTHKIVTEMDSAMKRLYEYVIPLEEERSQKAYGVSTFPSKILMFRREVPTGGRKVMMILVDEVLGF